MIWFLIGLLRKLNYIDVNSQLELRHLSLLKTFVAGTVKGKFFTTQLHVFPLKVVSLIGC